jgi:hypothetical protein
MRLQQTLDDGQLQRLYGALGPPKVLAYRLARERPLQRPGPGLDSGRAPGDDLR